MVEGKAVPMALDTVVEMLLEGLEIDTNNCP